MNNSETIYKPKDVAKILGVTQKTLINWEKSNKLVAYRSPTNRRFYKQDQIDEILGIKRECVINKNTTMEELEKIFNSMLEGDLKSIYVDDKLKKIVEKLFINYDVEIISI
ncbi:MAG: MerR family transcriptional regulator [Clostridia bacterium]